MSSLMNINNENGVIFVQGKERPMAEILPTNYNMFFKLDILQNWHFRSRNDAGTIV